MINQKKENNCQNLTPALKMTTLFIREELFKKSYLMNAMIINLKGISVCVMIKCNNYIKTLISEMIQQIKTTNLNESQKNVKKEKEIKNFNPTPRKKSNKILKTIKKRMKIFKKRA